jgi:hypothetical protein
VRPNGNDQHPEGRISRDMTEPKSGQAVPDSPADAAPVSAVRRLTPAAERALKEAAERRAKADAASGTQRAEQGGRDGPEPTRYGDWEKGGIVSDF